MKTESTVNSINLNGCSVCEKGKENYTKCSLSVYKGKTFYQYDYRHTDGELFSTLAKSLEECRERRDKWLQKKRFSKLFPYTLKQIRDNKRLTKSGMGYQIGHIDPFHPASLSWDAFTRDETVVIFNKMFGTEIK
ncbi:hypothetical protein FACS189430_01390 [Bacteroidia bacterium]|nr:hypothetical protein FACS189430_01390 [Bacteroidia bacterium]